MLCPKYRDILKASRIEGLYRPFSRELMVWRETSSRAASSSWVIPSAFHSSSSRFFTGIPPLESLLSIYVIPQCPMDVKYTFQKEKKQVRGSAAGLLRYGRDQKL